MRRAGVVFSVVATTVAIFGCASADHSWQGEFTARIKGALAAVEEAAPQFGPSVGDQELFRSGIALGRRLEFKRELIEELNPSAGCEAVQEEGKRKVGGFAQSVYDLYKNLTPFLREHLHRDLAERVTELEGLEREAAHCATG